jgi:hypothetical protein
MNKIVILVTSIIDILFLIPVILVPSLNNWNQETFRISLLLIGICAVINLILIAAFEYKIKKYKAKKFTLIMHSTIGVLAVAGIYILNYVENYDEYKLAYIFSILGAMLLSIIAFTILNLAIKEKPKKVYMNKTLNK